MKIYSFFSRKIEQYLTSFVTVPYITMNICKCLWSILTKYFLLYVKTANLL